MTVKLAEDLVWIEECYDLASDPNADVGDADERTHRHVSVYLVGEDRHVLVDSGSFRHREAITAGVADAVGEGTLDALILSHSDYPHAANVREFVDDDTELVASSGAPQKQGLPDARKAEIGGSTTVAGREFSFVDPPLADRSHTTWIYDHGSATLFTADGFGSRHRPGECAMTSANFEGGVPAAAVEAFHRHELRWLRYVDPAKLRTALDAILDEYPVSWIAPIHGHPISGEDLAGYLDRLTDAAGRIAGEGRPG